MPSAQFVHSCSACQTVNGADSEPKLHYGDQRFHYGCVPAWLKTEVLGDLSFPQQIKLAALIADAEGCNV